MPKMPCTLHEHIGRERGASCTRTSQELQPVLFRESEFSHVNMTYRGRELRFAAVRLIVLDTISAYSLSPELRICMWVTHSENETQEKEKKYWCFYCKFIDTFCLIIEFDFCGRCPDMTGETHRSWLGSARCDRHVVVGPTR